MTIKVFYPDSEKVDLSKIHWKELFGNEVQVSQCSRTDVWGRDRWKDIVGYPEIDLDDILELEKQAEESDPKRAAMNRRIEEFRESKRKEDHDIEFYPISEVPYLIGAYALGGFMPESIICFAERDEGVVCDKFVWPLACYCAGLGATHFPRIISVVENLDPAPEGGCGVLLFYRIDAAAVAPDALESYADDLLKRDAIGGEPAVIHIFNLHNASPKISRAVDKLINARTPSLLVVCSAVHSKDNEALRTVLFPWVFNGTTTFGLM